MTTILLTGATGTFGHAVLPLVIKNPGFSKVIVLSRDECKQHHFRAELGDPPQVRWMLGDIRDRDRLSLAFKGVDYVVHIAALKHVPAAEYNPTESIATNVLGSQNVARAAIDAGVKKVIGLSSDKACDPTTLYGATKLCMERIFLAFNALSPGATRFSLVRYGNVIGSRGSFVETLQRLRAEGAKTFPLRSLESTRFWMRAEDAARFVLDRLADMNGSEVFVPKLTSSTALSFARQYLPDATPEIVGIPRGEKIHETLISSEEWQYTDDLGTHFRILPNGQRHAPPAGISKYASNENPFQSPDPQDNGGAAGGEEGVDLRTSMPGRGEFLRSVRAPVHRGDRIS